MLLPAEIESKTLIPALRAILAKNLAENHNVREDEISKMLGVTQAAISNYIRGTRGDPELIKKLIAEENDIDFETNYMIYQLLGERSYLKTAYDQVKEREDVLDTNLREKFYNYPTPKAIIEEWQMIQS